MIGDVPEMTELTVVPDKGGYIKSEYTLYIPL